MKKMTGRKIIGLLLTMVMAGTLLAGCGSTPQSTPQSSGQSSAQGSAAQATGTVVIGSKQFSEQYILGYMIADLLKAKTKLTVDDSKVGMGPTELLTPAMQKGQIDLYPEYTGTALTVVLKQPVVYDSKQAYDQVKAGYEKQLNMTWLPPFGFNNTFAFAVRTETAEKLHLKTLSDLAQHPELLFMGDETTFTRPDQYPGLEKVYGFHNTNKKVMDVNLKYEALMQKSVDIIPGFSTDGSLKQYPVTVMEDDKHFFPPYDAAIVIRQETLQKFPQINDALKPLFGAISNQEMINMNYQVDVQKKDPREVADNFLKSKGLIQ